MLTIYVGVIIVIILCIIAAVSEEMDFAILAVIGFIAAIIIALVPGGDREYGEWKMIEEKELVSISTETVSGDIHDIYLLYSEENTYTYRYKIASEVGINTAVLCQTETLSNKNVEQLEDVNCKTPVLQVYEREGLVPKWKLRRLPTQTKYVFYLPEGSVSVS